MILSMYYYTCIVNSFTELAPQLLEVPGVKYLLREIFFQDPLERYFSRQRHRGGSSDNPTAFQVPFNAATLVQQQSVYQYDKTMSIETSVHQANMTASESLSKRARIIKDIK